LVSILASFFSIRRKTSIKGYAFLLLGEKMVFRQFFQFCVDAVTSIDLRGDDIE